MVYSEMRLTTSDPQQARREDVPSYRRRWLPRGRAGLRYRIGVAVRAVAAILGGYGVAALWATALALYLPTARVEASLTGIMVAFVVYPCVVMWVFAARSATLAWLGLLALAALPGALLAIHYLGR